MRSEPGREEALFTTALAKPPAERAIFLDGACYGDPALRQRLEARLAAQDQAAGAQAADAKPEFIATVIAETTATEEAGLLIGRYKLIEKLGEGGFGTVWLAEQKEPVRRKVALKIIKLGMDTKQVVARFEAERQALAMMDHPNIAKVLDAGTTEQGRPYFVMELVRGIKITDYCDQNSLATKERLDLFIKVCQAIQHAHQKGIIHRDIKPSNVMVTLHDSVPVPKVIDFGIAKATQQELTDKTIHTQFQQFIGTPAYMSPEQAEMSGLDVDTRSDIYSLGVLLYELLAGSTPFDAKELMALGIDAMRKTIREKEPLRPSTRLATLQGEELTTTAKRRSADTSKLLRQLKGDLDWIVMKCLEKDRQRRYDTANGLAFDLKRHLNNEPVLARPPSTVYKFQKAFRRNKLVFAAGGAVATSLVVGLVVAIALWSKEEVAYQGALRARAAEEAQRLNAQSAHRSAETEKQRAEAAERVARQRAYASDMNVAQQALAGSNLGRAQDLLNRQRPQPGQKDLRGWEWRYLWEQTHSDALSTLCQKSEVESLAASANGNWLAIGLVHKDGLFVYDLQTRQEVAELAPGEGEVRAAFSPAESLLAYTSVSFPASGKEQDTLRLWSAATRQVVAEFPLDRLCVGLAFAQDGRTLVTSTGQGHITLWRIPEGTKLASYPSEQLSSMNPATDFAATSDLGLAAYGTASGQVRVMGLHDGKKLWSAVASKLYVTALAFSPDGKTLASAAGFSESDIRLWNVATGKEIGRLEGHKSWVGSLVFWPDGKKLASCSADQTIRIWDVASRKCLDVLRGHRLEVWRLALLPDDKTLVSGAKDGTVCLWETSVTHPHQPRVNIPDQVVDWCFAPDSRSVLTLNQQGQVAQWTGADFQHSVSPGEKTQGCHAFPCSLPFNLVCNLCGIKRRINVAEHFSTIWRELNQDGAAPVDYWIENRILYTFRPLSDEFWKAIARAKAIHPLPPKPTGELAESKLFADQNLFIKILNRCLDQVCFCRGMRHKMAFSKEMKCHLFVVTPGTKTGRLKVKAITRPGNRVVYKAIEATDSAGKREIQHWQHEAFRHAFVRFGNQWYLNVVPFWAFTSDGHGKPSRWHRLSSANMRRPEKNRAVLGHVMFWASVLCREPDLVRSADLFRIHPPVRLDVKPAISDMVWIQISKSGDKTALEADLKVKVLS